MKRFSVMLLALVFVVAFTVPAMATPDEGLSVSGTYKLDGESNSTNAGVDSRWYDDDFELLLKVNKGDVTATVDLEISDNANFTPMPTTIERSGDIVDNYYIQWKANDALAFKIGEYGVSFGTHEGYYSQGHQQIGITYALDNVSLGLYLAKMQDGGTGDTNDDNQYTLTANFKDVGTFTKLNFIYGS
ncbi:MAG: hypothetical protein GXP52_06195, partial [Deltaproteobacteria bacterium]|nr:hypothetical protein [Deltaproteobacteria bacterium]